MALTVARPDLRLLLRSPRDDRVVWPSARGPDGLFWFEVEPGSRWILTVLADELIEVPVLAGQDLQILLP